MANESVMLSSIIDFHTDKMNTLSKGESKYKADLILNIINAKGPVIHNSG